MKKEDSTVVCRYFQRFLIGIILCAASAILTNAQITYSFSNPNPITINDLTSASPYPSTINVTNVTSVISKLTVSLNGLSHTFPGDIDIMLAGPNGQNLVIMSDVGGGDNVTNINLTLDDAAPTAMPEIFLHPAHFVRPMLLPETLFPRLRLHRSAVRFSPFLMEQTPTEFGEFTLLMMQALMSAAFRAAGA